jgi:general secretion pathway protein G
MRLAEKRAVGRGAFTLMEMLVVVAIILVLAGAAVPIYMSYLENARKDMARANVKTISDACEAYEVRYGSLPPSLVALTVAHEGQRATLDGNTLKDPWGRDYGYGGPEEREPNTGKPHIWSNGPQPGNPNSKIDSWAAIVPGQ